MSKAQIFYVRTVWAAAFPDNNILLATESKVKLVTTPVKSA
jgi:hypothetical protein